MEGTANVRLPAGGGGPNRPGATCGLSLSGTLIKGTLFKWLGIHDRNPGTGSRIPAASPQPSLADPPMAPRPVVVSK